MKQTGSTLSVAIITWNEERNIGRCLESLKFSERLFRHREIIVVDSESQDQTVAIARRLGAKVFIRPWKGYTDKRNWALDQCTGDWVLMLDADEELTPELVTEIESKLPITPPDVDGYRIKRRNFFLGQWIQQQRSWWPDFQLRLIRNGAARCSDAPIHEVWVVNGRQVDLDEPMNHYTYNSIQQFLEKMNRYSSLSILAKPLDEIKSWKYCLMVKPLYMLYRMYIREKGYLDGWHGFVLCMLYAIHEFCMYAKLWEKEVLKRGEAADSVLQQDVGATA